LEILEIGRAKDIYPDIRKEYEDVLLEIETLKVKLEKARYDVKQHKVCRT